MFWKSPAVTDYGGVGTATPVVSMLLGINRRAWSQSSKSLVCLKEPRFQNLIHLNPVALPRSKVVLHLGMLVGLWVVDCGLAACRQLAFYTCGTCHARTFSLA